ncbi:hypothetical protein [Chitinophaga eiseniae]|uniref:Uncharacterized protein n=1 Tax=Chitinophaga eiseniae TaxID=634771 RepID=A0A847SIL3_9BACT|nr:hypothetical protein [Chitinophaga eiseniae]NLR76989.1 hypothetical protein [Chitinophaga eiseniae]
MEQVTHRQPSAVMSLPIKDQGELTPELLRKFPGCEHYSDEQAESVIESIHLLAEILYDLAISKEIHNVDYQLDTCEIMPLNQAA